MWTEKADFLLSLFFFFSGILKFWLEVWDTWLAQGHIFFFLLRSWVISWRFLLNLTWWQPRGYFAILEVLLTMWYFIHPLMISSWWVTVTVTALEILMIEKSTTGYVFFMENNAISWCSKMQPIVTLSTCESEYVVVISCTCHVIWL